MPHPHKPAGVYAISATPFAEDGAIDWSSVDRLVDFYIEAGSSGLTILGIMGEAGKLDAEESLALSRHMIKRAGKLPVIVGVTAPGFAAMRSLARAVMDIGAVGVMIAPASSARTDDQIATYYRQAAEAIGAEVPFVIQDYPQTTNVVMSPSVIRRIVQENASCFMLKHEEWPGLEKISAVRGFEKDGSMRPISILTGNGALFLDFEMERGADGANTGYAFLEMLVDVVKLSNAGKRDEAHDMFDAHLPFLRYEQQVGLGLAVRKYVLKRRGVLACDAQRKPGAGLSTAARGEVDYLLSRLARRDPRAAKLT